MLILVALVK